MLNPAQQKAVHSDAATTIVIAGPGTGKTHTLIERIRYLITEKQIPPQNILAVTFTHRAADEMLSRIQISTTEDALPIIKTIHAWCYLFLTTELPHPPTLITEQEANAILSAIAQTQDITRIKETAQNISKARSFEDYQRHLDESERQILKRYTDHLSENHLIDFDGLLSTTYELLHNDIELRKKYQQQFGHILVDEYQDLNHVQQQLILLLAQESEFFVIGDPRQAIYGFRGANAAGFSELAKQRRESATITLLENYRSCQRIVDTAYCLFPEEPKQHAHRLPVGHVYHIVSTTEQSEALSIVRTIQTLIGGVTRQDYDTGKVHSHIEGEHTFGDFAILMRNRFQGSVLKKTLIQAGLPFEYIDHEESTNEDLTKALEHITTTDAARLPFNASLYEYVTKIFSRYDVPNDLSTLYFKEARALTTHTIEHDLKLFNELTKLLNTDASTFVAAEKINLITVHASKGLEWPVVFVPGLEDGVFPYLRDPNDTDLEEERRLLFVAMTRAKDRLYLTHSQKRTLHGKTITTPSRFLAEIPNSFFEKIEENERKSSRPKPLQKKLF